MIRLRYDISFSSVGIFAAKQKFYDEHKVEPNLVVVSTKDQMRIYEVAKLCWNARFYPAFIIDNTLIDESWYVCYAEQNVKFEAVGSIP